MKLYSLKSAKISLFGVVITILTACNYDHQHKVSFGANYDRAFISENKQLSIVNINDPSVLADGEIANFPAFIKQLNIINKSNAKSNLRQKNLTTYNKIADWINQNSKDITTLNDYGLNTYQMRGAEGYGNVLQTGYYSPILKASYHKDSHYKYPIYSLPKNRKVTREDIQNGVLDNQGLELVYTNSMIDNFLLGVQGSGYIELPDGSIKYIAYAGQNGYKYSSIGRILVERGEIKKKDMSLQAIKKWAKANPERLPELLSQNKSYVFFKIDGNNSVSGYSEIPLVAHASVAADRNVIPQGSVLLIETPNIDNQGKWLGDYSLNLAVALDVGGAVKGNHLDLYQGIGDKAGHTAGLLKHYGRVWLVK